MAQRFGVRWTSSYGDSLPAMWRNDLHGLSMAQIEAGIESIRETGNAWPPSSPQFRALCLGHGDDINPSAWQPAPMPLPEPPSVIANRRRAWSRALDEMANALGRRRKTPAELLKRTPLCDRPGRR